MASETIKHSLKKFRAVRSKSIQVAPAYMLTVGKRCFKVLSRGIYDPAIRRSRSGAPTASWVDLLIRHCACSVVGSAIKAFIYLRPNRNSCVFTGGTKEGIDSTSHLVHLIKQPCLETSLRVGEDNHFVVGLAASARELVTADATDDAEGEKSKISGCVAKSIRSMERGPGLTREHKLNTTEKPSFVARVMLLSRVPLSIIIHTLELLQDVEAIVGIKIRELRRKKGFTQDEFATRAGLNRTHLYRLESGRQSITLRTLKIVADALELRVRDLVWDL